MRVLFGSEYWPAYRWRESSVINRSGKKCRPSLLSPMRSCDFDTGRLSKLNKKVIKSKDRITETRDTRICSANFINIFFVPSIAHARQRPLNEVQIARP